MNKNLKAMLFAVLLIGAVSFAGESFRRTREPEAVPQTTAARQAAAPTQTTAAEAVTETTVPVVRAEATTGSRGTYTGLFALPHMHYTASDPENKRGLSTARIDHSFGVSTGGKPHEISVNSQAGFDKSGASAITYDNKTAEKVLYLTFDCGYENGNTSKILDVLQAKKVPAAFFCTLYHIRQEPQLIARMIRDGHIVGNHSDSHPDFSAISRTQMAEELEAVENVLREQFGYSSAYFRFPEGAYSECALDLVGSLGYTSVFWSCSYPDWDVSDTKGAQYALETVTARLHPGAILLLHAVSPDNAAAMADIIDTARSMGYTFRSLDEYGK